MRMASIDEGKVGMPAKGLLVGREPRAVEVAPKPVVTEKKPVVATSKLVWKEPRPVVASPRPVGKDPRSVVVSPKLAVEAGPGL